MLLDGYNGSFFPAMPVSSPESRFAFAGGGMNGFPQSDIANIFQQELCSHHTAELPEGYGTLGMGVTLDFVWLSIRFIFNDRINQVHCFADTTGNKATEERDVFVANQVKADSTIGCVLEMVFSS